MMKKNYLNKNKPPINFGPDDEMNDRMSRGKQVVSSYTKQEVEMLLKDKFKGNKFDWKGKQEWTDGYIRRMKACLKWFVDEMDGSQEQMYASLQEQNCDLQKNNTELHDELRRLESEKAAILQELTTLKAHTPFVKDLTFGESGPDDGSLEMDRNWSPQRDFVVGSSETECDMKEAVLKDGLRKMFDSCERIDIPEDPFSLLQDDMLIDIMSRISCCTTKELIRTTSTISKRWQNLWASVPHLIFQEEEDDVDPYTDIQPYISFIDNTINQCPTYPNLKLFKLDTNYTGSLNPEFKSRVSSWICYAISRNVEEFDLRLWDLGEGEFTYDDELFFNSCCITRIKLSWCLLNPPNGAISWERLEYLWIYACTLNEDMIETILSGSPCLKTLKLEDCYGYRRIDITSKSVKELVFSGYNSDGEIDRDQSYIDCVKINAPYISSLTIEGDLLLREFALLNVSSLVEAELDYCIKLSGVSHEEIFRGLIESLKNVNQITVGDGFSELLSNDASDDDDEGVNGGDQEEDTD